jgi:hypothetical protein
MAIRRKVDTTDELRVPVENGANSFAFDLPNLRQCEGGISMRRDIQKKYIAATYLDVTILSSGSDIFTVWAESHRP